METHCARKLDDVPSRMPPVQEIYTVKYLIVNLTHRIKKALILTGLETVLL